MLPPFVVSVLVSCCCVGLAVADEVAIRREDQFKAAYLFNFVQFVDWPVTVAPDVLTVCFSGGAGVYAVLAAGIEDKHVGNRRLAVRRTSAGVDSCNVLYLDAATVATAPSTAGLPILTVSDSEAFARNGGMIELFMDGNRLRFRINVGNAQKAGLRISSDLLRLAAAVEGSAR